MQHLPYSTSGTLMPTVDSAFIDPGEDVRERFLESVVATIATDVEVIVGGVKLHLAAWEDPDHWSEDWREQAGVDAGDDFDAESYVNDLLATAVTEYVPRPPKAAS